MDRDQTSIGAAGHGAGINPANGYPFGCDTDAQRIAWLAAEREIYVRNHPDQYPAGINTDAQRMAYQGMFRRPEGYTGADGQHHVTGDGYFGGLSAECLAECMAATDAAPLARPSK